MESLIALRFLYQLIVELFFISIHAPLFCRIYIFFNFLVEFLVIRIYKSKQLYCSAFQVLGEGAFNLDKIDLHLKL